MPLNTLLLDTDINPYELIATAVCLFLAALELGFTLLFFKKKDSGFLFVFLLPAVATVFIAKSLVYSEEEYYPALGICSFAFMLVLLGANVREMLKK